MHHPVAYGSSPATGPIFAVAAYRCQGGGRERASNAVAAPTLFPAAVASSASRCAVHVGGRLFYAELRQLRGDGIFWAWWRSERLAGMIFVGDNR